MNNQGWPTYQFPDSVKNQVNDLFPDSVVATGIVVGGIFFASDELFGMKELAVGASADLIC